MENVCGTRKPSSILFPSRALGVNSRAGCARASAAAGAEVAHTMMADFFLSAEGPVWQTVLVDLGSRVVVEKGRQLIPPTVRERVEAIVQRFWDHRQLVGRLVGKLLDKA